MGDTLRCEHNTRCLGEGEVGLPEGEGVHIRTKALERVGIASAGAIRTGPVYNQGCHRGVDGVVQFPLVVASPSPPRAPTINPTSTLKPTGVPTPGPTTFVPTTSASISYYGRRVLATATQAAQVGLAQVGCCGAGYMCGFPRGDSSGEIVRICYDFNSMASDCDWPAGATTAEILSLCPGANNKSCSSAANSPCTTSGHEMTNCGDVGYGRRRRSSTGFWWDVPTIEHELAPAPPTPGAFSGVDKVRCFAVPPTSPPPQICATYTTDPRLEGASSTNGFHPVLACGPKTASCGCPSPLVFGHGRSAHIDTSACVVGGGATLTPLAIWGVDVGGGCPRGRPVMRDAVVQRRMVTAIWRRRRSQRRRYSGCSWAACCGGGGRKRRLWRMAQL